ncbi:MAG: prepilin-type N-terminal cleavage/methylation domain-containing protein [Desulfobulbaceae bacterium]|nr:prepilin-type N-terminal cleavage/methylation domain-containing protein [Desulfobulbaceae bacterium]
MINKQGFSLIEVMVSMVILSIGMLALNTMQIAAIKGNATANHVFIASNWNSSILEEIAAMSYDDPLLDDSDLDGTKQDLDNGGFGDGIDDDPAPNDNFGLTDIGDDADQAEITEDGLYTIYWNIAVDHPVPNTKMVSVHVVRNLDKIELANFNYIKYGL